LIAVVHGPTQGSGTRVIPVFQRLSAGDERAGGAAAHGACAPEPLLGRSQPNAL